MVSWILKKILGSKNQREIRRLQPIVRSINVFDEQFKALSDDELRAKTSFWSAELSEIEDPDALARRLEEILPEAFAVVKNACRRLLRQRRFIVCEHPLKWEMVPFDVQLIGGMRPAPRQDRGNGHRRRQDARRHAAGLSQRPDRPRRRTSSR